MRAARPGGRTGCGRSRRACRRSSSSRAELTDSIRDSRTWSRAFGRYVLRRGRAGVALRPLLAHPALVPARPALPAVRARAGGRVRRPLRRRAAPRDATGPRKPSTSSSAMSRGQTATASPAAPSSIGAATVARARGRGLPLLQRQHGLPFVPTYDVTVQVPDAAGLVRGNEVRIGGKRVGVDRQIEGGGRGRRPGLASSTSRCSTSRSSRCPTTRS